MQTIIISRKGERQWQGIPAIERAANGRLWCAFFSGGSKEPEPENYILLTSSSDQGVTWSEPEVVIDLPGKTRAYDPALWHDPDGRLWLFYNQANLEEKDFSVWAMTADDSGNAKPTWSSSRKIELDAPFAFRLNKPTVLSSGEWLLPVTFARKAPDWWFNFEGQLQGVAISKDKGATWTFHGAVDAPKWALENMIVERKDGRLWMLIRTNDGVIWQSFSVDGGETWSEGTPTDIVNPGVRFFIRRLASGRLLLINTPDPKQRKVLKAYLSGESDDKFSGGLELDGRDRVSYPDAIQSPDGIIYAVHDCDRNGVGEIILNVFKEDEVLA